MSHQAGYRRAGILGGMGPAATIRLYEEITARTPLRREQDHLPLLIDSNPAVPDRTAALLAGGPDPLPALLASARRLVAGGADFLAIACNTAHCWYDRIAEAVPVPVLHLIRIAARTCRDRLGAGSAVGVMATRGTLAAGLYQEALRQAGLRPVVPDEADQAALMQAIMQIKAGGAENLAAARRSALAEAARLVQAGSAGIVLGCTDLSVIVRDGELVVPVIDSTVALAEAIIAAATGRIRPEDLASAAGRS